MAYVDDILVASKVKGEATRVFDELEKEWRITGMGEAKFILGLKIQRDRQARKVWLSQPAYIDKCCETFSSETMNRHITTPLPYNIDEDESHFLVDATPYRKGESINHIVNAALRETMDPAEPYRLQWRDDNDKRSGKPDSRLYRVPTNGRDEKLRVSDKIIEVKKEPLFRVIAALCTE
ncbi:hypothetical protein B9479_008314, partial [Cryptococcus floricola]